MLLGNYIVFTLLVIAVFVLALVLSFAGVETNLVDLRQVGDYDAQLSSGRYDEFPVRRLLGEGGSIAVLDSRGGVVYNPVGMTIDLSPEETAYIPDVLSEYSIFTNELKTAGGQTNYEIVRRAEPAVHPGSGLSAALRVGRPAARACVGEEIPPALQHLL